MKTTKSPAVFTVYPFLLERQKAKAKKQNLVFDLTTYCVMERIRTLIDEVQKKQGRGADYYESRQKLAEMLEVSPSQIDNSFHTLKNMGLIQKTRKERLPQNGKPGRNASWAVTENGWRTYISWCKTKAEEAHQAWKTSKTAPEHTFYTYIPAFHKEELGFNRTAQIQYFELHCLFHKQGCREVSKFTRRAGVCRASHYNYVNTDTGIGKKCFSELFETKGSIYKLKPEILDKRAAYLPENPKKNRLSYSLNPLPKPPKTAPRNTNESSDLLDKLIKSTQLLFPYPSASFQTEISRFLENLSEIFDLNKIKEELLSHYRKQLNRLYAQLQSPEAKKSYLSSEQLFRAVYPQVLKELKQHFQLKLDKETEQLE